MKKILFVILGICLITSSAFATVTVEGFLNSMNAGDAEQQYGFGFGIGIMLTSNINFLYRGGFDEGSTGDKTAAATDIYGNYEHSFHVFGIEYTYTFPQIHLGWQTSVLGGLSSTSIDFNDEVNPVNDRNDDDDGFTLIVSTGVRYDINQYVSPFIEAGYHYCVYQNTLQDDDIRGFSFVLGVRFRVWGKNKSIDSGY